MIEFAGGSLSLNAHVLLCTLRFRAGLPRLTRKILCAPHGHKGAMCHERLRRGHRRGGSGEGVSERGRRRSFRSGVGGRGGEPEGQEKEFPEWGVSERGGSGAEVSGEGFRRGGSGAEGKNEHHVQQVNIKRVAAAPGKKFPRAGIDELSGGKRAGGGERY